MPGRRTFASTQGSPADPSQTTPCHGVVLQVGDEEIVEGVDEPACAVARSREAAPVREEDPRVGSPDAGELRGDRQGVADVLGQRGAALFAS